MKIKTGLIGVDFVYGRISVAIYEGDKVVNVIKFYNKTKELKEFTEAKDGLDYIEWDYEGIGKDEMIDVLSNKDN